jgi:hypothetical protein
MKRKMMMTVLCAAAVMLTITAPLAAQTSATKDATATTFETDIDKYMSVNDYSTVELNKLFAFTRLQNNNLYFGFAKKLGALYLGTVYYGNALHQNPAFQDTTTVSTVVSVTTNGLVSGTATTTTKTINTDTPLNVYNNANVLIGVAGMGFRVAFDEEMNASTGMGGTAISTVTTDTSDNSTTSTKYTEYSARWGYMTPSIKWGMNLPLGGMTLKPNARVAVAFNKDTEGYTRDITKTVAGVTPYGFATQNRVYLYDYDYIAPNVNVGATLAFAKKDGVDSSVGLEYTLDLPLYGDGTTETTTVKTTTLNTGNRVDSSDETVFNTERTAMTNTFKPSYSFTKELSEKVSVGFNANATVSMYKAESTPKTVRTVVTTTDSYSQAPDVDTVSTVVTTTTNATTAQNTLTVTPRMNVGFTYKVIPGKFVLNGGYAIYAPTFSKTVTTSSASTPVGTTTATTIRTGDAITTDTITTPVDASYTNNESESNQASWSTLSGQLRFGTRFNFSEQFALDASTTLGSSTASLFGAGGILESSYSLAFTLKY